MSRLAQQRSTLDPKPTMAQSPVLSALSYLVEQGIVRPLDLEFARFLWAQEVRTACDQQGFQRAELSAKYGALVSVFLGRGHVCVQLDILLTSGGHPLLADLGMSPQRIAALDEDIFEMLSFDVSELSKLASCVSISFDADKPLVLEKSVQEKESEQGLRLYLNRYWHFEETIAAFVTSERALNVDEAVMRAILDEVFPNASTTSKEDNADHKDYQKIDYQKLAAAVALTSKLSIITGGPGTGKTYTVVRLLAALIQYHTRVSASQIDPLMRTGIAGQNITEHSIAGQSRASSAIRKMPVIKLAAPTGKAAARMLESIRDALGTLPLSPEQKAAFPDSAHTLHRLLGPKPLDANFKHDRNNPLHLDVLIVDEASMIDLPMMAKLLDAMPPNGRLVLLGDRDQLASVEAGAVLNDLCQSLGVYSPERAEQLSHLTGYQVPSDQQLSADGIQDALAWLKISRRFGADSGIGHLAKAINAGDVKAVEATCASGQFSDVRLVHYSSTRYVALLIEIAKAYEAYIRLAQQQAYQAALTKFSEVRLLCALREGEFGVQGLNQGIADCLSKQGVISRVKETDLGYIQSEWYVGRPVMVTRNDHALGLYNGDIGVVMEDEHGRLRVYVDTSDGIKAVLPSRMPEHETAYAMTVHKSQGSEFEHTYFILPDRVNPVLTKELVYTAVTRAKKKLTLMCMPEVLANAVQQRVQRFSGLKEKLSKQEGI